jgi:hypothetical protein
MSTQNANWKGYLIQKSVKIFDCDPEIYTPDGQNRNKKLLFLNCVQNLSLIFFSGTELRRSLIYFTLFICNVFSLVSRNALSFRFSHTASVTFRYFGISSDIDYKQTILRVRNCNLKRD